MSSSNIPQIQITSTGVSVPAINDILDGALSDIDSAFGGGINKDLRSPQGQLATVISDAISQKNAEIVNVVNQFDPNYASGKYQDALGNLYFLTRKGALSTIVTATISGVIGTIIPAGTLAKDTNNNSYISLGTVTISAAGTVAASFSNIVTGAIACPAGTLTTVGQAISGWDSITNPSSGILGNSVETRADFEERRGNSVSKNANGTPGAIYGQVFEVAGVLDCYVIDNFESTAVTYGSTNYSVLSNSIYVAVVGGADADIAQALLEKKDIGCGMNGNTSVTVQDNSGYSYPAPTYVFKFERPTAIPIKFDVQVANNASLPTNFITLAKQAIIDRFTGVDGTQRERIAATIFASRYYGAISSISPQASILSILIGTTTATSTSILNGIDQYPTITDTDITVILV